jgi:hypothetical protein
LGKNYLLRVTIPATGSGSGFDMKFDGLTVNNIPFIAAPETLPLREPEFREWAEHAISKTLYFVDSEQLTESTLTPQWDRSYPCSIG